MSEEHRFHKTTSGDRTNLSTGKIWEDRVGYSRAVRKGSTIAVAGTMGYDAKGTYPTSPAEQLNNAMELIEQALGHLGGTLDDVVRTRIYLTNIEDQGEIGAAHSRWFGQVRPAATMVEVSALAAPEAVVEIEVEALLS